MKPLIAHLERHLGSIEVGWTRTEEGQPPGFQVARFSGSTLKGIVPFSTVGLSNFPVPSRRSGKPIRLELVFLVASPQAALGIPSLLQRIGGELLDRNDAILRGDVVGPRGPLVPDSSMVALYVSAPSYLPDSFAVCQTDHLGPVVLAWLVPISEQEARFVASNGWEAFEELLAATDPPLEDLYRSSMPLGVRDSKKS
jgi:hypothetical protein